LVAVSTDSPDYKGVSHYADLSTTIPKTTPSHFFWDEAKTATMPFYFDQLQLEKAITTKAIPVLEFFASHPNYLEQTLNRRFDREEPPQYESEGEEVLNHPVLARTEEAVMEGFRDRLRKPLADMEITNALQVLNYDGSRGALYTPGGRFMDEARLERQLLRSFLRSEKANKHARASLQGPKGLQRCAIIVRHNIRKRWERLGVWNPEWGIPGAVNEKPNDNPRTWKWKWQSDADPLPSDPQHPVRRAIELRRGLGYGEHVPPPPHSHLRDEASSSEAESFIISRPWFVFEAETVEFRQRKFRIPLEQWGRLNDGDDDQVTQWWKERGDWKKDWEVPGYRSWPVPGWKWRHESPSPEPEDLTRLNTDEMDFTPSEVEALEAILPDTPQKPKPTI
jgi:hypothetical protein